MLEKTKLLIFTIFLILISITAVCANDNSTFDEITTADDSQEDIPILSSGEGNFTELSELINGDNNVISLDKDYKYSSGDTVTSSGITINKPITVNGNGHTIDASNFGRIFSISSSNVIINNITFINSKYSGQGAAIYASGQNLTVSNSTFSNNYATSGGAAIFTSNSNTIIDNCNFEGNTAYYYGGAIRSAGANLIINNSHFDHNSLTTSSSYYSGGAVYSYGLNPMILNSEFTNNINQNGAYAAALSVYGNNGFLNNSKFINNTGGDSGAIYWKSESGKIDNSEFINNTATNYDGGAIGVYANNVKITNSYFEGNSANNHGGGIFFHYNKGILDNLTFVGNKAATGAGAYLISSSYSNDNSNSGTVLNNSRFISNHARYGGAGVDATSKAKIMNCEFINNTAGNYGGAVGLTNSELINATLTNNSAIHGGAVYTYNSKISNSTFTDNHATDGNSVYILDYSTLENNIIYDSDIFVYDNGTKGSVISNTHNINNLMTTDTGYFAYCAERYNTNPYTGVYDNRLVLLKNSINHQPIGEYLKILIYQYLDHMEDLRNYDFHDYVWIFTDKEYWNSTEPIIKEVIKLYDEGFRVPTENACKVLSNGTLMYFNFSSMISPSGQQNLFLFKFDHSSVINETLDKEVLNKTAIVGDNIEFRIVISNKGTDVVYDNFIEDKDYSNGLVYQDWRAEVGNWSYDNLTGHWKLPSLNPGNSASIILIFKVLVNGTLYNNATSGVGNINVTNSSDKIRVYNPNMTVEKITINKTVELGEQVKFEIVVKNTGDKDLDNITVTEFKFDGLIFDSYEENELWSYSKVNGKPTWKLNKILKPKEVSAIIVIFNTTDYGNFTNIVVVGSNETDNKTCNNTTKVLKPDFTVQKNTLTPFVIVGNQTEFEIIVKNTGEVDLDDIVVIEENYYGLRYDHADTGDLWAYEPVNGKHAWRLNYTLKPGAEEYFFIYFNTTIVGNFTNYIVATSNKTDNKTGNNTTVVNKTVKEEGNFSNFTVKKITLDKTVIIGNLVEFQILVKNTGNTTIHNLTVYEDKFDGLTYHSYHDHFDLWEFNEKDLSWRLNSDFYPGEELGIHVFFNTTRTGTFTNCVVVTSNETDNKTGNNTTKVFKPGINIEKNAINKTVIVGEQVTFEIIVHNIGEEILYNVTVRELEYEGLIYDHFIDHFKFWSKNDDLSWTLNKPFAPGEYEGFYLVFNTTKRGTFTNYVSVHANDTDNDTDNDTVDVLGYNLTVSKITLNNVVKIGQTVEFEIIVKNTGDLTLSDVFVIESKYDSGLVYLNYVSIKGNWKHSLNDGKHMFTLIDDLKAGDSSSFRVIFNTTQIGNFTNTVVAGYNNTNVTNSTNATEVVNKTTNETESLNKTYGTGKGGDNNNTNVNLTHDEKTKLKTQIDNKTTGNPILLLLLVLVLIPIRRFKN